MENVRYNRENSIEIKKPERNCGNCRYISEIDRDEFIAQQKSRIDEYINSCKSEYTKIYYNKPRVKQALEKKYSSNEEKEKVMMQIYEAASTGLYELRKELFVPINKSVYECRRSAPALKGWPLVKPSEYCGDHKYKKEIFENR